MLPSADTKFNYAALPTEKAASARAAAERIRGRMQLAAESIIEVGKTLNEQKESLGHSNFMLWIESEFDMSQSSANKMMAVARELGDKFVTVTNLGTKALYALAAPSTPEPVRTEVLERAAAGEKVTAKEIEALKRKLEKAEEKISEKEAQRAAQESRANIAARQVSDATNRAMFAEADKERLAEELQRMRDELERATEPGVINVTPIQNPNVLHTDDGRRAAFNALAAQFIQYWNSAPIAWRNEFLLGRYFPDDLAEALNIAA